jgi:hypothetical protein
MVLPGQRRFHCFLLDQKERGTVGGEERREQRTERREGKERTGEHQV